MGAPTSRAIDRPFGHGMTAVFGTRDVDTRRDGTSPQGPTGPFQSSTNQGTTLGYLTIVTLHPFIIGITETRFRSPTEEPERQLSLLRQANAGPRARALGPDKSPPVLQRLEPAS